MCCYSTLQYIRISGLTLHFHSLMFVFLYNILWPTFFMLQSLERIHKTKKGNYRTETSQRKRGSLLWGQTGSQTLSIYVTLFYWFGTSSGNFSLTYPLRIQQYYPVCVAHWQRGETSKSRESCVKLVLGEVCAVLKWWGSAYRAGLGWAIRLGIFSQDQSGFQGIERDNEACVTTYLVIYHGLFWP